MAMRAVPAYQRIGYYASWRWYDRKKLADPNNFDFSKYDIINFAFFQTDTNGFLYGTDADADPIILFGPIDSSQTDPRSPSYKCMPNLGGTTCNNHHTDQGLINLVHKAGKKILPSIGGWTLSNNFSAVAASKRARSNFVRECMSLIGDMG
eukprot:237336_1